MEAAPSVKPRRGSPPIPPDYVSLRQLQELRLKEEEEKQQQEAARKAEIEEKRRQEARKAEMEAMAAAAAKRNAARKPDMKVSAVVSVSHVRAKERSGNGPGGQWVAVAHRPAVAPSPPPPRREDEVRTIGVGRGNRGRGDSSRGGAGGKPEGKAKGDGKGEVPAITSVQTLTDEPPSKPAESSSLGGRPGNKASRGTSAEPGSIGGSGESAGASSRHRNNPRGKKGAGGRGAEPSPAGAPAKAPGASPPQGVEPENGGKPNTPGPKRAGACPVSDSSNGKKADARPAPPTSAAAGSVDELRTTVQETKPERLVDGRRPAEQKPRVAGRGAWPRPPGDRCTGAREQQGRVWVPKAAASCSDP